MSVPNDLLYTRSHEWTRVEGDVVVIGITHYAQDQLGEVVYVELPEVGVGVDAAEELGTLESVKAVSEFNSPVGGEVVEINERLEDEPNLVNEDPYGDGWLVKINGSTDGEDLLDAAAYTAMIEEESACCTPGSAPATTIGGGSSGSTASTPSTGSSRRCGISVGIPGSSGPVGRGAGCT